MASLLDVYEYNQHFVAMMNVINAARLNPPVKGHNHHIIPKCWFKMKGLPVDNSKDNLVMLSFEDHWKVHKLALLCSTTAIMRRNMALAVHRLTEGRYSEPKYWSGKNSPMYGKPRSIEICKKISDGKKEHMNAETRKKISDARKGRTLGPLSDEHRAAISKALKGRTFTSDTRKKISDALKGKTSEHKGKHWKLINGKRVWYG